MAETLKPPSVEGNFPLEETVWLGKDPVLRLFCRMTKLPDMYGNSMLVFMASPQIINLIMSCCEVEGYTRMTELGQLIVLDYDPQKRDIEAKIIAQLNSLGSLLLASPGN